MLFNGGGITANPLNCKRTNHSEGCWWLRTKNTLALRMRSNLGTQRGFLQSHHANDRGEQLSFFLWAAGIVMGGAGSKFVSAERS